MSDLFISTAPPDTLFIPLTTEVYTHTSMPSSKSNQMKASYLTRCAMIPLYLCKLWF